MNKFIYVFNKDARDKLKGLNYKILKTDEKNNVYIFENKQKNSFQFDTTEYLFSDVLTF